MTEIHGAIAVGKVKEVIYARFDAGADVLVELKKLVKERNIRAGLILEVLGSVVKATFAGFKRSGPIETTPGEETVLEGPLEVIGQGVIGETEVEDEPYIHVHVAITVGKETYVGHLLEGTIVRSHIPISHFSVIIAVLEGIKVMYKWKEVERKAKYPEIHVTSV